MNETLVQLLWLYGEPFASIRSNPHYWSPYPSSIPNPMAASFVGSPMTNIPCIAKHCDKKLSAENSWIVERPAITIKVGVTLYEMRDGAVIDGIPILKKSPFQISSLTKLPIRETRWKEGISVARTERWCCQLCYLF